MVLGMDENEESDEEMEAVEDEDMKDEPSLVSEED